MDKLATRLTKLPLILAGPILRRVTDSSVTVWVALKNAANVTLQIKSATGANVGNPATAPTIAVGRFLHIVAVTAPVSLTPEVIYTYDMSFATFGPTGAALGVTTLTNAVTPASVPNPISYPPYPLPSFALPPTNLTNLRIIHGSCRKPHGNGPDALSILDGLIAVTAQNATERPHQLLFTGDQIYADDVAASLLMQLTDASSTLLGTDGSAPGGWLAEELLPNNQRPTDYPPLTRTRILGEDGVGFTSDDTRSHLISLGEYLSMYLFTWSDVLWPAPASLPTQAEVTAAAKAVLDFNDLKARISFEKDVGDVPGDLTKVVSHLKTLPKVRRALANIPTYMILDDHDVTDDWNMTLGFCEDVYGSDLGRRVVQNALVAYALCQLWGNTPEQFQSDAAQAPAAGRVLLTLLDQKTAASYVQNSAKLQGIVGVHTAAQISQHTPKAVYHDQHTWLTVGGTRVSADSLVYNFTYTWPTHQLIVTDTRSWRSYAYGDKTTADLLPPDQITAQIPLPADSTPPGPDLGDRALIIVVSTNAPPAQPLRAATRHDIVSTRASIIVDGDAHPDLYEAWEIPSLGFDRLLKRITDTFKPDAAGIRYGQAVLLSGDVHFSFATRLSYNATNRYEDTTPQKAHVVVAQLVASAFKNQTDKTLGFQREGYFYAPVSALHKLMFLDMTEGYAGWNLAPGQQVYPAGWLQIDSSVQAPLAGATHDEPTVKIFPSDVPIAMPQAPHYRYRLDYLLPEGQSTQPQAPNPVPPLPANPSAADRQAALATFNAATGNYRAHNQKPGHAKLIGRNNISELTFDWPARDVSAGVDSKKAIHTVRWRENVTPVGISDPAPDPDDPLTFVAWTTYSASLDPNDTKYPDKKAAKEGP
jgi:hypothetical protein